jgi:hypothetical protein
MITFFSEQHVQHAPQHEFFRGERVPCFESPARARYVQQQLVARGHVLREPDADSRMVLAQVHTARYLAFLEGAWADWLALEPGNADHQPFPSVWPVRSLAQPMWSRRTSPPGWAFTRWTTVRRCLRRHLGGGQGRRRRGGECHPAAARRRARRVLRHPSTRATMQARTSWAATAS